MLVVPPMAAGCSTAVLRAGQQTVFQLIAAAPIPWSKPAATKCSAKATRTAFRERSPVVPLLMGATACLLDGWMDGSVVQPLARSPARLLAMKTRNVTMQASRGSFTHSRRAAACTRGTMRKVQPQRIMQKDSSRSQAPPGLSVWECVERVDRRIRSPDQIAGSPSLLQSVLASSSVPAERR